MSLSLKHVLRQLLHQHAAAENLYLHLLVAKENLISVFEEYEDGSVDILASSVSSRKARDATDDHLAYVSLIIRNLDPDQSAHEKLGLQRDHLHDSRSLRKTDLNPPAFSFFHLNFLLAKARFVATWASVQVWYLDPVTCPRDQP
jgi:hypothetical protein